MVGVVLAVAIGALYTASLRGKIKRRQIAILRPYILRVRRNGSTPAEVEPAAMDDDTVFVAPGRHRFHRAGCPALQGLDASLTTRSDVDPSMVPCGICATP